METSDCDDTGCLDTVFQHQQQRLADMRKADCQLRKIKILQSLMSVDDIIRKVKKTSVKDDVEAEKLRIQGNSEFQAKQYRAAVSKFSDAMMACEFKDDHTTTTTTTSSSTSRTFSLAAANRSLALVRLDKHEAAVDDIEVALESGYPEHNRYKLLERKGKCYLQLGQYRQAEQCLREALTNISLSDNSPLDKEKLKSKQNIMKELETVTTVVKKSEVVPPAEGVTSRAVNSTVPAFSSCVEIMWEEGRGRYGVATRDLLPGTEILQERPLAAKLKAEHRGEYCDHCLARTALRPLPCSHCSVVYCSRACRLTASRSYHSWECGEAVSEVWSEVNMRFCAGQTRLRLTQVLLCYRLIVQRDLAFWRSHQADLLRGDNRRGSGGRQFPAEDYHSFFSLISHRERLSQTVLQPILATVAVLLACLQMSGYLGEEEEEEERMMCEVMVETLCIMRHNSHAVVESVIQGGARPLFNTVRSIAVGLYPSLCLLNTCCDQNITKYFQRNQVVGVVCKLILAGEEVSDNYFPSAVCTGREERRAWLCERYMFHCQCWACTTDLPTTSRMPNYPVSFVCQTCRRPGLTRLSTACPHCGLAFHVEAAEEKIKVIVNQILAAAQLYKTSQQADPYRYYQEIKALYTELTCLVSHPLAFLVLAEQHFLTTNMIVKDNSAYDKGIADFFGDAALAEKFSKLVKVEDKLKMMWKAPMIQKFLTDYEEPEGGKSEGDSRRFRDLGNNQFKVGKDLEAIEMFNRAIMKAPTNEEKKGRDLSLAIANKSAALMRLGYLKLALEDVEFALQSGYPADLRYKLLERKIKIAAAMRDSSLALETRTHFILSLKDCKIEEKKKCVLENEVQDILEALEDGRYEAPIADVPVVEKTVLSQSLGKAHDHLPCMSDSVEVEYSPERGRFAVASKFIPAGSVLIVEPAVSNIIREDFSHRYCDLCYSQIQFRLVPCQGCAEVAFCSTQCREKALAAYHGYECGRRFIFGKILENAKKASGGKNVIGSTVDFSKLCFRAIASYPVSWYRENKQSVFEEFPKFGDDSWDKTVQHSLLNLVSHHDKIKPGRLWSFLVSAVCHLRALQTSGYFGQQKQKMAKDLTDDEALVGRMLVHLFELMQFNTHGINEATDKLELNSPHPEFSNKTRTVGDGLYPTVCLLNHSCDSNVFKYFSGSTVVVLAAKNIEMGDEVTEGYFPHVQVFPRDERRVWLAEHYRFLCQCPACEVDLPSLENISNHYVNFSCGVESCRGLLQETGPCPTCDVQVDVDSIKVEVEKVKQELALATSGDQQEGEEHYRDIQDIWVRLQKLVKHPYKQLFKTEQIFWKAIRTTYGNQAIRK